MNSNANKDKQNNEYLLFVANSVYRVKYTFVNLKFKDYVMGIDPHKSSKA